MQIFFFQPKNLANAAVSEWLEAQSNGKKKKKTAFLESRQPLERTEIWVNIGTVIRLFLGGAQCSSEVLQTLELCGTYIIPSSHRDSWGRGSATSCWSELSSSSSLSSSSPYPRESETQQTGITSNHIGYLPLDWAHISYRRFLKNGLFLGESVLPFATFHVYAVSWCF